MPNSFSLDQILVVIIGLLAAFSLGLYLLEYRNRRKILKELIDPNLNQVDVNSRVLLNQALQHSGQIIADAENKSLDYLNQAKTHTQDFEDQYQKRFSDVAGHLEDRFKQELELSQKEFLNYLTDLRGNSDQAQAQALQSVQQRVSELVDRFEQNLTDFFTQTQQQSIAAVELELKSARALIDTYKQQQLLLLDENIIAVLERTLSLVLSKKLALNDQLDLVYDALEQAKVEKFIA